MTIYEIRQEIRTVRKAWLEVVSSGEFERVSRDEFARLVAAHPGDYFELAKVTRAEECLEFTCRVADSEDAAATGVSRAFKIADAVMRGMLVAHCVPESALWPRPIR